MAKKEYFLILDTETTQDEMVADFGAIICDRKGRIYAQCAVLVNGIYTDQEKHPLFYTSNADDEVFGRHTTDRRYATYNKMVTDGTRMLASVAAINLWLAKAIGKYDPILTAYNLAFDLGKCRNTGIDLTGFSRSFCLWHSAFTHIAGTRKYRNFAMSVHAFNAPTKHQNMSYKTNAETMTRFVLGQPDLVDEPHTALEDAIYYEMPILQFLCSRMPVKKVINDLTPFNWRSVQVRDHFTAA